LENPQGYISRIETCGIRNNQILGISVENKDVERCADVIRTYGMLTPPVVGSFKDGGRVLLSGECEMLALKRLGVKDVDAVTIPISEDEAPKLSLLIAMLKKSPNAISEGLMLNELLKGEKYNQYQLGKLLGKSTSWISKRISLATKLKPSVCEMVTSKQLCPHSAQEISRMPLDVQHSFAVKVIQEGLPKSSVEVLVAAYGKKDCPESLKQQILEYPCHAAEKIVKEKAKKTTRTKEIAHTNVSIQAFQSSLVLLLRCVKDIESQIHLVELSYLMERLSLLKNCQSRMQRLCILIESKLSERKVSPGKLESEE